MPEQEKVRVNIKRDFSIRRAGGVETFYPGVQDVPKDVARFLELSPEFVATDGAGVPLPNTVAASALGYSTTPRAIGNAIPAPDTAEAEGVEFDTEPGTDPRSGISQEVLDGAAEGGERLDTMLRGEDGGSLSDDSAERGFTHVGQTEESEQETQRREVQEHENLRRHAIGRGEDPDAIAGISGSEEEDDAADTPSGEAEQMTKSELRSFSTEDLEAYARDHNIRVKSTGARGATKEDYVEALHKKGARLG